MTWSATAVLVMLALLVVDGLAIFRPELDEPGRTDALVVLGPSHEYRTEMADRLMREGVATALVVSSHPADLGGHLPLPCTQPRPYPVHCFDPDPATTRGEARGFAELARRHGWRSVRVVTFEPQVSRARLLFERCYDGAIHMSANEDAYDRPYQFVYQTGALVKAFVQRGC